MKILVPGVLSHSSARPPSISTEDLDKAHCSLEAFCVECEILYDLDPLSPNMHLHLYLKETIVSFGPVYGYWLFSFERFNGVLKNYATNWRNGFEANYMRRYLEDAYKSDLAHGIIPCICPSHAGLLVKLIGPSVSSASFASSASSASSAFVLDDFIASANANFDITKGNEPLPPSTFPLELERETSMKESEYLNLLVYYQETYDDQALCHYCQPGPDQKMVNNQIQKMKSIHLLGQVYKGGDGMAKRRSYIQALFQTSNDRYINAYTGQIQYLFVNTTTNSFADHLSRHVFAYVRWYKETKLQPRVNEDVEVNEKDFVAENIKSILPVHRILVVIQTLGCWIYHI
ncbi:hypothetical protein PHYBLDRAFT_152021 [Phycomyces blakesleeanus NRRL 1555(-)]|uniref:Uncharacterized protein n=1 Tax=Phycomyces blakesleeanus (strain ATCC 8743b / DSM 1359 / FGSC 10004 / NBRC 33097 / NRRL 1555) TaxID=763407 RepID=A0A167JUZ1_PHYB8|nr:hypothetical protein PHYBLDRAFT_152021 [Phycomyces blakesleeanus NRRL 1555(-)]OAD66750.1 hypothetical protein PHYBLDRAFT_152021 [Phycomyces blakesleeanus NRRL 1555(-)]|eukprot:XP_018284790.1 hypothetical protein PHYBLDRAFT_152021 [Phycomyces blakesleeanus NRRL 1555(-)]